MAVLLLIFVIGALLQGVSCHPDAERHLNAESVAIIGGHHIRIEKAPFMASLRLNGTFHWCGASIIHEKFLLTAAHCIVPNRVFKVLVGTDDSNGGSGELFEIDKIIKHESWDNKTFDYDFCLLKLKKPLTFGPKVDKIDLALPSLKLPVKTEFNVTGWGSTGVEPVSVKLLQVEIPKSNRRKCKTLYAMHKQVVTQRMICAGNLGHDSCQGDSGGPLTFGNIQVGVTSFGLGVCGYMPGIYGKVTSVAEWIQEKIISAQ